MAKEKKATKFFSGTGRRKTATARVWLYDKKGDIKVNDKLIKDYFTLHEETLKWIEPFHIVGVSHPQSKFSATIKVSGGGSVSQAEAVEHGIARALVNMDPENKAPLKSAGLLTRDSRKKERKKPFLRKARKRPQYSKR